MSKFTEAVHVHRQTSHSHDALSSEVSAQPWPLPLLDAMVPAATALAQTAAAPKVRLGFCFIPHGAVMANWTPAAEGPLQLSPILAPLEHVQGSGGRPQQPRPRDGRPAGSRRQRRRSHPVPRGVSERRASETHRRRRYPGGRDDRPDAPQRRSARTRCCRRSSSPSKTTAASSARATSGSAAPT